MRTCRQCGVTKPLRDFEEAGRYRRRVCRMCRGQRPHSRAVDRSSYIRRRAAILAQKRDYHEANRQHRCRAERERYAKLPEEKKRAVWLHQARTRRHGRRAEDYVYSDILGRDPCAYCGAPADTIDHIQAIAAGGVNGWENLTAACRRCNGRKRTRSLLEFLAVVI